jgi:hypothetical protein
MRSPSSHRGSISGGPLGVVVGVLMRRLTRQYLAMEARCLKRASEERWQGAARA